MKATILKFLKIFIPLGIGVYLSIYMFSSMSSSVRNAFFQSMKQANYWWISFGLFISLVSYWSRAYRWKHLLEPLGFKSKTKNRFYAVMIGYAMNLTVPRAGEVSRAYSLQQSEKIPFSTSFGTIVAERIVDVIIMGLFFLLALFLAFDDLFALKSLITERFTPVKNEGFPWIKFTLFVAFIVLVAIAYFLKSFREKWITLFRSFLVGLKSITQLHKIWSFLIHTLIIWAGFFLFLVCVFFALAETANLGFDIMLVCFVVGTFGISLTNGGIGIYPLLIGLVIHYYLADVLHEKAEAIGYALGMLLWGTQQALVIILGIVSFVLIKKKSANEIP